MKSQTRAGLGCPPPTSSPGTPDRQRHLWARLSHSRGFIASVRKGGEFLRDRMGSRTALSSTVQMNGDRMLPPAWEQSVCPSDLS